MSPYNISTPAAYRLIRSLENITPVVHVHVLTNVTNNFTIAYTPNLQVFLQTETAQGSGWTSASTGLLVGAMLAVGVLFCSTFCVYYIIRQYSKRTNPVDAYFTEARTHRGGRPSKHSSKRWRQAAAEDESTTSSMEEADTGSATALLLNHRYELVKVGIHGAARAPDVTATGMTEQSFTDDGVSSASTSVKCLHHKFCKCSQPYSSTADLQPTSCLGANASYQYSGPDEQDNDGSNRSTSVKRTNSFGVRCCSGHAQRTHSSSGGGVGFCESLASLPLSSSPGDAVRLPVQNHGATNPAPVGSSQSRERVRPPASLKSPNGAEAALSSGPCELTRTRCTSHASRSASTDDARGLAISAANEPPAAANRMAYLKDEMLTSDVSGDSHLVAMVDFLPASAPSSQRRATDVINSTAASVASPVLAVMPPSHPVQVDDPSREPP